VAKKVGTTFFADLFGDRDAAGDASSGIAMIVQYFELFISLR
jgi:hypothetical protein